MVLTPLYKFRLFKKNKKAWYQTTFIHPDFVHICELNGVSGRPGFFGNDRKIGYTTLEFANVFYMCITKSDIQFKNGLSVYGRRLYRDKATIAVTVREQHPAMNEPNVIGNFGVLSEERIDCTRTYATKTIATAMQIEFRSLPIIVQANNKEFSICTRM